MRTALLLAVLAFGQFRPSPLPGIPKVSDRKLAPDGITEGWLVDLDSSSRSSAQVPTTLVISRRSRELNRFHGEPGIASWDFWSNGQQVVYQTAPIHGRTTCIRADVQSGHILDTQENCSGQANPPDWTAPLNR